MRYIILFVVFLTVLVGCEDRYRYYCQDPQNFSKKRCQRPDCLFTQDCPDYLVAPILEKQATQPQPVASEPSK